MSAQRDITWLFRRPGRCTVTRFMMALLILARLLRKDLAFSHDVLAAHSQSSGNLFARRETRDGRASRVRAGSQDVQRRIILGIEDHPITVQVTRASFVFISLSSYLLVGNRRILSRKQLSFSFFHSSPRLFAFCQHRSERLSERVLNKDLAGLSSGAFPGITRSAPF